MRLIFSLASAAAFAAIAGTNGVAAAEPQEPLTPEVVAKRLWSIIQVVQDQHVQPPAREALLRAVLESAGRSEKYAQRLAAVNDENVWVGLLQEHWAESLQTRKVSLSVLGAMSVGMLGSQRENRLLAGALALAREPTTPLTVERWQSRLLESMRKAIPGGLQYFSPHDFKIQEQLKSNRYVGTGIQIRMNSEERLASLVYCFPGGPARRAGGLTGDLIVEVDGEKMDGCGLSEVVNHLRGDEGTPVTMVVRQPGAKETRTLNMIRSVIPFASVEGYRRKTAEEWDYRIEPGSPIAYLRLPSIGVSTAHELRQAERRMQGEGFRALVLDLRLSVSAGERDHEAALVANAFLEQGVLWRVRGVHGQTRELRADGDCSFRGWPMVVLCDALERKEPRDHSATLVAAALQDNERAKVVGSPIGTTSLLMQHIPLPDGQGVVALATASVERAQARAGQEGLRVQPDHLVFWSAKSSATLRQQWYEWRHDQSIESNLDAKPPADPQLAKAVEVLQKALAATSAPPKTR